MDKKVKLSKSVSNKGKEILMQNNLCQRKQKTSNYFYTLDKSEYTLRTDYFFTACFLLLFKYD